MDEWVERPRLWRCATVSTIYDYVKFRSSTIIVVSLSLLTARQKWTLKELEMAARLFSHPLTTYLTDSTQCKYLTMTLLLLFPPFSLFSYRPYILGPLHISPFLSFLLYYYRVLSVQIYKSTFQLVALLNNNDLVGSPNINGTNLADFVEAILIIELGPVSWHRRPPHTFFSTLKAPPLLHS